MGLIYMNEPNTINSKETINKGLKMFSNKEYPYGNNKIKVITKDGQTFNNGLFASVLKTDSDIYFDEDYFVLISPNNRLIPWTSVQSWDFYNPYKMV